jgi:hypothetical protein
LERCAPHALEVFGGESEVGQNLFVGDACATVGGDLAGLFLADRLVVVGCGSSMISSSPTTTETWPGAMRSMSWWACSLVVVAA